MMKIPVFVSCPTSLNEEQEKSRNIILRELSKVNLEPRALGRSDYPTELPLREVYLLAKHCSGGVILGFEQFKADGGKWKVGTKEETASKTTTSFPSPWNQLESGILFSLNLPLLVFKEESISGGVFDNGVTDVFIHLMPDDKMERKNRIALTAVFQKWQARVRNHYYR